MSHALMMMRSNREYVFAPCDPSPFQTPPLVREGKKHGESLVPPAKGGFRGVVSTPPSAS